MNPKNNILLTIDVEDWFQVENFKPCIPFETWDQRELRVERNVHLLLDLFDSVESAGKPGSLEGGKVGTKAGIEDQNKELNEPNQLINFGESVYKSHAAAPASNKQHTTYYKHTKKVRCTFFVLGWLADRLPTLVREIQSRGHEIASHGYNHKLPDQLSATDLKTDLTDSKKRLEDLVGSPVSGYRAPSFAINDHILKSIEDCGYRYDSSYNSFGLHGRYGKISLNGAGKKGIAYKFSDKFYELPVSNFYIKNLFSFARPVKLFEKDSEANLTGEHSALSSGRNKKKRFVLPWGGGGYFRLLPSFAFHWGIKAILKRQNAYMIYVHPWEIDPDQPRVEKASVGFKFRHYTNLNKTKTRLKLLIESFDHCQFVTCSQYLTLAAG